MMNQTELERSVVGVLIRDSGKGAERFVPGDFNGPYREIFKAIQSAGSDCSIPALGKVLNQYQLARAIEAIEMTGWAVDLSAYGKELRRQSQLRVIRQNAIEIAEKAGRGADPDELARIALERFRMPAGTGSDALMGLRSIQDIMAQEEIVGPSPEVRTTIPDLDRHAHIGGGTLNVIAARPGGGKSAIMLDWSVRAAQSGYQVLFFSLEMGLRDIRKRLWTMFPEGAAGSPPVWIQEPMTKRPPIGHLVAMSAEFCRMLRDRPTLVVVDYIQIVAPNRYWQTRRDQVGEVVRELKAMAMALDIPVVAGAQLSRSVEQRGPKSRPQMSDLKEAGEIEEVADLVCLLHRPSTKSTDVWLGVAKNRHGIGHFSVPLSFLPSTARFLPKDNFHREDWQ